jgi:hypothetical protein
MEWSKRLFLVMKCDPFGIPSTKPVGLKLVGRMEFGPGAVTMRYELRR